MKHLSTSLRGSARLMAWQRFVDSPKVVPRVHHQWQPQGLTMVCTAGAHTVVAHDWPEAEVMTLDVMGPEADELLLKWFAKLGC